MCMCMCMWPLKTCHTRRLETVQSRHLRYILGIRFATHGLVSNESIRKRCDVPSITTLLHQRRLRWLGHVGRMSHDRLPIIALHSRPNKKRLQGRPFTTWRQVINSDLRNIRQNDTWMESAADRKNWRRLVMEPQQCLVRRSARLKKKAKNPRTQRL